MEIKKIAKNTLNFVYKRFIELIGFCISITGLMLLIALLTYSPEDPNFIFSDDVQIKNILGLKGSIVSDIFFQSVGLVSILIAVSIFITGLNVLRNKNTIILIENLFFVILYSLFGSLFFSSFNSDSFWLAINGNGGFVGQFLKESYISNILNLNKNFSYYFLILIVVVFFLLSVNFKPKKLFIFLKSLTSLKLIKKNRYKNFENEFDDTIVSKTEETNNLVQENFSFLKDNRENKIKKKKFILPPISLLKNLSKKNKTKDTNVLGLDPSFLEKILLDFGVEGKIKKISSGPVVTLNEFEPAAGVKVSKIINLSEDIARNTSSESARISTIPGRNTVGIELPNPIRENVHLSEILSDSDFLKKDIKLPIALGKNISSSS